MPLTDRDIKVGRTYRAKRPTRNLFGHIRNDRTVTWISDNMRRVQYDSETVAMGRQYPAIDMEKFLNWADREVKDDEDKDADRASENRRVAPRRASHRC